MIVHSKSPEQTFQLGLKIGKLLKGKEVLLLSGELGAGKTLLTKGIAESIGLDADDIVSPTFTLMNLFHGDYQLVHIDLYRLGDRKLGSLPEIDDNIGEAVIVVEWAQYLDDSYFNMKETVDVRVEVTSEDERSIRINTKLDHISI